MIRFRLSELIAEAQFRTGRRITLIEIAEETNINRMTLSRMVNTRGYSTSTDTIDKLCKYFGCSIADVATYIDDETVPAIKSAASDASDPEPGDSANADASHGTRAVKAARKSSASAAQKTAKKAKS